MNQRSRIASLLLVGAIAASGLAARGGGQQTGTYGSTLTAPPVGSRLCPGGADASQLVSPYTTAALAQAAFPANGTPITVAAGDNSSVIGQNSPIANTTYYLLAGTHTVGLGQYNQIIPKVNDVFVGAPGAVLSGQNSNNYATTGSAAGVTVEYLEVTGFASGQDSGALNLDGASNFTAEYDYIHNNAGAGIMGGINLTIQHNCISDNGQYAANIYCGSCNILTGQPNLKMDYNELARNDTLNYDHVGGPSGGPGCGCAGAVKFWNVRGASVTNNYVHDNNDTGLWADTNNTGFDFENNWISGNWAEGLFYEISYNTYIHNNVLLDNAWGGGAGPYGPGFPYPSMYISESGADSRVSPTTCGTFNCGATLDISNNTFTDNWGGVTLWENSNRWCGAPAQPSADCPLGNQAVATKANCTNAALLPTAPYVTECRWRTMNVAVHNNIFNITKANVTGCTHSSFMCGYNALMSNWGTSQISGDPYVGNYVANNIMYNQNNTFSNNQYGAGSYWCFDVFLQGNSTQWPTWIAGPDSRGAQYWGASAYNQDAGSLYTAPNTDCTTS